MTVSILVLLLYLLTGQLYTPQAGRPMMYRPNVVTPTWCYYGNIQAYLRCPPGHGVKK